MVAFHFFCFEFSIQKLIVSDTVMQWGMLTDEAGLVS